MICSGNRLYASYQWYFNNTLIKGATDTIYIATENGNYNIAVRDTNGCSFSTGINIILGIHDGFEAIALNSVCLYPNPAEKSLQFTVYS